MAYQLQEINRRIRSGVEEFLAECDENYAQRVSLAADRILSNLERSPIVLLSGPSGSGKTTTAMKIAEELRRRGVNSHAVAMDNYFVTLDPKTAPRTPEGIIDYESPLFLDMELLDRHFTALSQGEEITVPRYEFARKMRNDSLGTPLKLEKNEIAIFEGCLLYTSVHTTARHLGQAQTLPDIHVPVNDQISAIALQFLNRALDKPAVLDRELPGNGHLPKPLDVVGLALSRLRGLHPAN